MLRRLRFWIVVPTLLTAGGLIGCGKKLPPAVERLPGNWHGQMIVYEDEVKDKLPLEQVEALKQMQMDFQFQPDGVMALSGVDRGRAYTNAGRWEMVKQEGDLLTIKSSEQSGAVKDINIEFDGSDTFYIPVKTEVAELGAMRFTRVR